MEALLQSERQSSFDISICVMYVAKACVQCSIMCSWCCQVQKGKKMETWINEVIFLPIYYLRLKWCQNSQEKQVWVAPTFQRRKSKGKSYPSKTGADDSTGSIPTAKSVMNWFCLCDARLSLLGVWAFIREGGKDHTIFPDNQILKGL